MEKEKERSICAGTISKPRKHGMFRKNMERRCLTESRQDSTPYHTAILPAWSKTAQRVRYNRKLVTNNESTLCTSQQGISTGFGFLFLFLVGQVWEVLPFYPSLKTGISKMSPSLLET